MEKKTTITRSLLVIAGTTVLGSVYCPVPYKRASAETINAYLQGKKQYNPFIYRNNWNYSENRKAEILAKIGTIRSEIRAKADTMQRANAAHKMLETIACTMENRTRNRDSQLRHERAQEIHIPARLIAVAPIRARKGMPVVDLSEII